MKGWQEKGLMTGAFLLIYLLVISFIWLLVDMANIVTWNGQVI